VADSLMPLSPFQPARILASHGTEARTHEGDGRRRYTFADQVAAAFLAQMLKRVTPFGPSLGAIAEVHFETGESGQILDDLRLVLRNGNDETRCAVSVKSAGQLGVRGFSKEFVRDAWEQAQAPNFDFTRDLLVLVLGALNDAAFQAWRAIEEQAAETTADRLVARFANGGSSAVQKHIFEGLRRLSRNDKRDAIDTARLASRMRVIHFSDEREQAASAYAPRSFAMALRPRRQSFGSD
jgi:hypothetical protein